MNHPIPAKPRQAPLEIKYEVATVPFDSFDDYKQRVELILDLGNRQQQKDFKRLNMEKVREYAAAGCELEAVIEKLNNIPGDY